MLDVPGRFHRGLVAVAVIMSSGFDDTLTNLARPKTSAIITVRVIKSFEFRTERRLVLRDINLETTTVGGLKEIVRNGRLVYAPRNHPLPVSKSTLGFDSDPDPARMETLSLCAFWSAHSLPSATLAKGNTLTLPSHLFLRYPETVLASPRSQGLAGPGNGPRDHTCTDLMS